MLHAVNKSCTTPHAVAWGGCACEVVQKNRARHRGEKAQHFSFESATACQLREPRILVALVRELSLGHSDFHVERKWFFFWNRVTRERERERERERGGGGGGESEIEQTLPLARTSFSVAFPTICMQRRDKRDSNVSRRVIQRGVTKRSVAYRPAIRLSRSFSFPTCLCLPSRLSSHTSGAQWRQERRDFSPSFSFFELHSLFMESISWVSEGPSSLKWKQTVKKKLWTIDSASPPRP